MFKNSYQGGLLSIFYSCGSDPLAIWETEVQNGHIKRVTDNEVNSIVLEIVSTNVATTYISCPKRNQVLGIRLPFLVMIVKNLKRYFSFEIMILDDKNMRRRFRISNFQSTTKIKPFCTSMPIGLSGGWNQIQFNLADFTRRAYGSQFIETLRVQIHANARLRRIYFSERLFTEDELPQDYKLYLPLEHKHKKSKEKKEDKKDIAPIPPPPQAEIITEPTPKAESEVASKIEPEPEPKAEAEVVSKVSATTVTPAPTEDGEENMPKVEETAGGETKPSEEPAAEVTEENPDEVPAEVPEEKVEGPLEDQEQENPPAEDEPVSNEN